MKRENWEAAAVLAIVVISIGTIFLLQHFSSNIPLLAKKDAVAQTCSVDAEKLLDLINTERSTLGAPTLQVDSALNASSLTKLNDMVTGTYFGHNLVDGSNGVVFIRDQGVKAASSEDLDANGYSPGGVWEGFRGSPAHYASLTDKQFTRVGISTECTDYKIDKETDSDNNLPIGTQVDSLTVVHLAAPEPQAVQPTQQPQQPQECAVTTCNDGSCSNSTGSGTCSWHGGVAY